MRPRLVHCDRPLDHAGFTLIEVMFAMVILAFAIVGVLGSFQWAEFGMQEGEHALRAVALAEARLEAKRAASWASLLADDLDGDGHAEATMRDDGLGADRVASDGIYAAAAEYPGIHLVWTVAPEPPGPLSRAAVARIEVYGRYEAGPGRWREFQAGLLRANPGYVGP